MTCTLPTTTPFNASTSTLQGMTAKYSFFCQGDHVDLLCITHRCFSHSCFDEFHCFQRPLGWRNLNMGQGYSLTTLSAGSAGIDIPELSDLSYEKSMGGGRFMKSIRARQQNGLVFVKVIMKPFPSMELEPYVKAIIRTFLFICRVTICPRRSNLSG